MNTEINSHEQVTSSNTAAPNIDSTPLFTLGQVVATPGGLDLLNRNSMTAVPFLSRHQCGDFGDLDADDIQESRNAIQDGARIMSSYTLGSERLWVITEADRSVTILLLPSEY